MKSKAVTAIEILLVDDHTLFRESLRRLIDGEAGFRVCGDFASGEEAMAAIANGLSFDVALIDYELAGFGLAAKNGLDLLRTIRVQRPDARAVIVTAGMEIADLHKAVKDLKAGVFLKTEPTSELIRAIERTAAGEQSISSGAMMAMLSEDPPLSSRRSHGASQLTQRESLVLRGILEGLGNKEIGARLDLTESSVKAVLQKLFEKTGVRSRSQLVRYAIEMQIDLR